jgi:hypothetical protein
MIKLTKEEKKQIYYSVMESLQNMLLNHLNELSNYTVKKTAEKALVRQNKLLRRDPATDKYVVDKDAFKESNKLTKEDDIKKFLEEKVKDINKTMPNYKFIKDITITTEPLIKTTTLKIKRFEEMKKLGLSKTEQTPGK